MSTLESLQRAFLDDLFAEAAPARPGVAIYRRTVLANLHNALAATYPVVRRLVGNAFFREAAERFARAVPSASGDLNLYGEGFADFLARYPFARELAYLPDVAHLEWACHESFHAAEAAPLDVAALARVPAELHGAIRLVPSPCVRLVASSHPVLSLWEANQPGRDGTPESTSGAEHVLVSRIGGEVRPERITREEWHCVRALSAGLTLEESLDAAGAHAGGEFLAPLLARLAARGALADFIAPGAAA